MIAAGGIRETDHVRRVIVTKVFLVEYANRFVIRDANADFTLRESAMRRAGACGVYDSIK